MNNILSCNNVRLSLRIWYTLSIRTPSTRFQSTSLFNYHSLSCRWYVLFCLHSNPSVSFLSSNHGPKGKLQSQSHHCLLHHREWIVVTWYLHLPPSLCGMWKSTEHRWYINERSIKLRWKSWYFGPLANKFRVGWVKVEKKWRMLEMPLQVKHRKFALCERIAWVDLGMTT